MPDTSRISKGPPSVLVLDASYSQIEDVIEKILETFPFPWKGNRVVIKPNILSPSPPEKGITTHPSLIRSLVKALKRREAHCLVGDNPGLNGYAANERCARISGIFDAANGCFVNFAKETAQINARSRFFEKLVVSKVILDADLVIDVPKFKTHLQTRITGAIKNMFGILVGAEKARVHLSAARPENFSEALVDIYQIRIPDLTIMDAVVGMEGNGPSSQELRPIGKILAARNGVAVDGLMAAMMGIPQKSVDCLRIAFQRDLGEIDPARMEIQGSWSRLEKFKMPLTFVSQGLLGAAVNKLYYRPLVKPRLSVRPELCTVCGVCVQHCPVQALTMGKFPLLDSKKCISCYCCYELCSNQAIELTGLMRRVTKRDKLSAHGKTLG
ncbi:MAG: DUF362 domain-containing protein [Deltaproteobacteria bacterium]|nr:DUF362 domain-containing protein [Deltaproteobacteria bacterium]